MGFGIEEREFGIEEREFGSGAEMKRAKIERKARRLCRNAPKKKRHQVTETLRLQGIEESASISIVRVLSSKFSYRFPLFFR